MSTQDDNIEVSVPLTPAARKLLEKIAENIAVVKSEIESKYNSLFTFCLKQREVGLEALSKRCGFVKEDYERERE